MSVMEATDDAVLYCPETTITLGGRHSVFASNKLTKREPFVVKGRAIALFVLFLPSCFSKLWKPDHT